MSGSGDGDIVEIGGIRLPIRPDAPPEQTASSTSQRPFLRLFYRCANAYTRAYKSPDGSAYVGICPQCGKQTRFAVGEGGTNQRSFEMSCLS